MSIFLALEVFLLKVPCLRQLKLTKANTRILSASQRGLQRNSIQKMAFAAEKKGTVCIPSVEECGLEIQADRALGLLLGLAAGDRNRGPIQMALTLAESLTDVGPSSSGREALGLSSPLGGTTVPSEKNTGRSPKSGYDPVRVAQRYLEWWQRGEGPDAWDTGPVAAQCFTRLLTVTGGGGGSAATASRGVATEGEGGVPEMRSPLTIELLEATAREVDRELKGMTAGTNAVHRVAPLALCSRSVSDAELCLDAHQESRITHWSPISQLVCAVVVLLCRRLVRGVPFRESVEAVLRIMESTQSTDSQAAHAPLPSGARLPEVPEADHETPRENAPTPPPGPLPTVAPPGASQSDSEQVLQVLRDANSRRGIALSSLNPGGFCIDVLRCALHFVGSAGSFEDALVRSLRFAGIANFCPVLVGALAGALFGAEAVLGAEGEMLQHCRDGVVDRCRQVSAALAREF